MKLMTIGFAVLTQSTSVTDGQTDILAMA